MGPILPLEHVLGLGLGPRGVGVHEAIVHGRKSGLEPRHAFIVAQIPSDSTLVIDVSAVPGETWKISVGLADVVLPKEVQIVYETGHGETQYMSFLPASPIPGCRPSIEAGNAGTSAEEVLRPKVGKQDSGLRKGSSGGEQEIEDLPISASSLDASQVRKSEEISAEAADDDWKGKATVCDVQPYEVRSGEDMISICSLD